jgi:phosphoglucosamine mutase
LFAAGGRKLSDSLEARVEHELVELAHAMPPPGGSGAGVGVVAEHRAAQDEYVARVVGALEGRRLDGMPVVLDCGNGAAFRSAPAVLRALGADVEVLHATPDGSNINEKCGSTHPEDLRDAVAVSSAAIGLAFDGDADRVIAVDERGELIDGDQTLAITAIDLHDRGLLRGGAVVTTVMSNLGLQLALEPYDVELVRTPVGDRNVLDELERRDLVLGGEQSGHIINRLHGNTGDGTLTGILLMDVMARRRRPLSELGAVMTSVPQVHRNVPMYAPDALNADTAFWGRVEDVEEELGDAGRVLVRVSGTEPVVRVMVESPDRGAAEAAADRLVTLVEHVARRTDTPL